MNSLDSLKSSIISQFGTPCPVIDLDIVKSNIDKAQRICDNAGVANRPHIKTHKSPLLAKMQIDAGAKGITCQKLGEAEIMADAGIDDILIATNIIGAARSGRLASLQKKLSLKVCADNKVSLSEYSKAAEAANRPLDVLIECDTGQKRAGVEKPGEALRLIELIIKDKWLKFTGLLYYPPLDGWKDTQIFHDDLTKKLNGLNLKPKIISTGGTPNFANIGKLNGATEHRAGTCIFNDMMMVEDGFAQISDCGFRVFTSVVSKANDNRGILDAGSKTLTSDTGGLKGFGYITEYPEANIIKFSEEHGFLELKDCKNKPSIGDIVTVIPNHVCVAVNMVDKLVMVQNNKIIKTIPVAARGMLV
ncbi:MAG: alanine racemase [Paracoccaceae bacterium]|jgi:D-serine deaminase-like pyridoxal phosphate-dependent protein|tara:strand:+ start:2048 stop:3133 length:1086 start_codon:yes stop_codon:yes gene_type:complete